jgi:hypothetical protein
LTILPHEHIIALSYENTVTRLSVRPKGGAAYDFEGVEMPVASSLETELRVFEAHRKEWAESRAGKFVVIQDERILDFFDEYSAAFKAGLRTFGVQRNFLVKQIWIEEPVYFVG